MKYEAVKLFMGLIFSGHIDIKNVQEDFISDFGDIDFESEVIDFNYTDYYCPEMGKPLFRKFISFRNLIYPGKLASIKNITCKIEERFAKDHNRGVNIDPGYIEPAKIVLASTKNFFHRIYLGEGIYGEVTLYWKKDEGYKYFDWTFPDYRTPEYRNILEKIRDRYMITIKA